MNNWRKRFDERYRKNPPAIVDNHKIVINPSNWAEQIHLYDFIQSELLSLVESIGAKTITSNSFTDIQNFLDQKIKEIDGPIQKPQVEEE